MWLCRSESTVDGTNRRNLSKLTAVLGLVMTARYIDVADGVWSSVIGGGECAGGGGCCVKGASCNRSFSGG